MERRRSRGTRSTSTSARTATRWARRGRPTMSASSTRSCPTWTPSCPSTAIACTRPASPTARRSPRGWLWSVRPCWRRPRSPAAGCTRRARSRGRSRCTWPVGTLDAHVLEQTGPPALTELPLDPLALLAEPIDPVDGRRAPGHAGARRDRLRHGRATAFDVLPLARDRHRRRRRAVPLRDARRAAAQVSERRQQPRRRSRPRRSSGASSRATRCRSGPLARGRGGRTRGSPDGSGRAAGRRLFESEPGRVGQPRNTTTRKKK